MNLPFSQEQFLEVFSDYNQSVYPAQPVLLILAAAGLILVFKSPEWKDKAISAFLAFLWAWMGFVYHLLFFSPINKAAYLFGMLFLVEAGFFLWYGAIRGRLKFRFGKNISGYTGVACIVLALLVYPALGLLLGRAYPQSPTFGLPCPTTIYTFGMLLLIGKKIPASLSIVPLFWAVIGFTAAISLGIWEDISLLLAAMAFAGVLLVSHRKNRSLRSRSGGM